MVGTRKPRGKSGSKALLSPEQRAAALEKLAKQEESAVEQRLRETLQTIETAMGGRAELIKNLIVSKHPAAKKFLSLVAKPSWGDKPLYDILKNNKTSPDELLHVFSEGQMVVPVVQAVMKLAGGLPAVMDIALESAQTPGPDGFRDRQLLLTAAGIAKTERSGGVNINLSNYQLGTEGIFEKVITRGHAGLHEDPFTIDIDPEDDDDA